MLGAGISAIGAGLVVDEAAGTATYAAAFSAVPAESGLPAARFAAGGAVGQVVHGDLGPVLQYEAALFRGTGAVVGGVSHFHASPLKKFLTWPGLGSLFDQRGAILFRSLFLLCASHQSVQGALERPSFFSWRTPIDPPLYLLPPADGWNAKRKKGGESL